MVDAVVVGVVDTVDDIDVVPVELCVEVAVLDTVVVAVDTSQLTNVPSAWASMADTSSVTCLVQTWASSWKNPSAVHATTDGILFCENSATR